MRYPEFLKPGQTIGCVAPSFGAVGEPYGELFRRALQQLQGMGYEVELGPNVYKCDGIGKSTNPRDCGAELNEFFCSRRCDMILSCGGGETMCEDLPFVDFEAIAKAPPKWYMGYSDNTNMTFTLPTLCDTAAIYGPCAPAFGRLPWDESTDDAFRLLTGEGLCAHSYDFFEDPEAPEQEDPYAPSLCTEPACRSLYLGAEKTEQPVRFSGRLLGGCLDLLLALCGTRFDKVKEFNNRYRQDGTLWFLEACDLNPMCIRRGLWQLRQAGWFDTATGFLIGRPLHFREDYMSVDRISAVIDTLGDMNLPVALDLDIGHLHPMMPIISGAIGIADFTPERFTLQYVLK